MKSFTTSFGTRIAFVEGYREAHSRNENYKSDMAFVEEVVKDRSKLHTELLDYRGFIKDIGVYSLMADALHASGQYGPWKRGLDIGGAEGAIARLMVGSGLVKSAVCNDYVKLDDRLPEALFRKYFRKFSLARMTGGKMPRLRLPDLTHNFGPALAESKTFKTVKLRHSPALEEYVAGDFMAMKRDKKFDLISSLLVINYFDANEKIARISEMLEEGGVFVLLASSFWWPINAAMIVGHFPYTSQRLNRPDLERYMREHVPSDAEDAMKRYDYFHKTGNKPTLDDYIEIADRNGLSLLRADYLIPTTTKHKKTRLSPFAMEQTSDIHLSEILSEVQQHNPSVRLLDLKAAYVMGVFRKRRKPTMTAAELLKR